VSDQAVLGYEFKTDVFAKAVAEDLNVVGVVQRDYICSNISTVILEYVELSLVGVI